MSTKTTKHEYHLRATKEVEVHGSGGNVFADLGLSDPDARLAKAELAHEICPLIKSAKLTQVQASRMLGIDQPKISALNRGRLRDFSTDRLLRFINLLGRDVHILIRVPEHRRHASIRVFADDSAATTAAGSRVG